MNFFTDKKFIVHLKKRKDRSANVFYQIQDMKLENCEIVDAIDGSKIQWERKPTRWLPDGLNRWQIACLRTHLDIIKRAKREKLNYVTILEDDFFIEKDFEDNYAKVIQQLPEYGGIFYLGCNHAKEPIKISENVVECTYALTTVAYVMHNSVYDIAIEELEKEELPIDMVYGDKIQQRVKCIAATPNLISQMSGFSEIERKDVDYSNYYSELKLAVIIYHSNIEKYPKKWIDKCVSSIREQTYKKFDVFELNYSGGDTKIYSESNFISKELPDHAQAHNYLLDLVFSKDYDYCFNVNVDDFYCVERFAEQIKYAIKGYDVISSNFYNVDCNDNILKEIVVHDKNIEEESKNEHNIICHPVICYSRRFWTTCSKLQSAEIPKDDFNLWKRSYSKYKFIIIPKFLHYYRIHESKTSNPAK